MWPHPETRPTVIPVFLDTLYDFKMLERAAQNTQKFAITAYQMNVITGGVFPYNLMTYDLPEVGGTRPRLVLYNSASYFQTNSVGRIPQFFGGLVTKLLSRNKFPPLIATVTDVSPNSRYTRSVSADDYFW